LQEKNEIRDALSLLKIYHRASSAPAAGATARNRSTASDATASSGTTGDDVIELFLRH